VIVDYEFYNNKNGQTTNSIVQMEPIILFYNLTSKHLLKKIVDLILIM
jgi:hypothetical protein